MISDDLTDLLRAAAGSAELLSGRTDALGTLFPRLSWTAMPAALTAAFGGSQPGRPMRRMRLQPPGILSMESLLRLIRAASNAYAGFSSGRCTIPIPPVALIPHRMQPIYAADDRGVSAFEFYSFHLLSDDDAMCQVKSF